MGIALSGNGLVQVGMALSKWERGWIGATVDEVDVEELARPISFPALLPTSGPQPQPSRTVGTAADGVKDGGKWCVLCVCVSVRVCEWAGRVGVCGVWCVVCGVSE